MTKSTSGSTTDDSTAGSFTEDAAATFVAQFAQRFAAETTTWIEESATAFADCFQRARSSSYTADTLVADMAAMWGRNLAYLGRLVNLTVPPKHQADDES
jgi:hypothetical protein